MGKEIEYFIDPVHYATKQVKIKYKHQVWIFFSLPSFHKHIGKSIQLEAKYFHKFSTGI